ncbi:MAG: hypothetical protein ACTS22_10085 [Phycisphaerales bacterium]
MPRTVLLEHALPDGSSHFDWLIARTEVIANDERTLVSFRVAERLDRLTSGETTAERLPDHRGVYVRYEGEIGGDRGAVKRVAEGEATVHVDAPGEFSASVQWRGGASVCIDAAPVCGAPGRADAWLLTIRPA